MLHKLRNLPKITKGGLHKDLHNDLQKIYAIVYARIYTSIYTRSHISIYTTFEVLRLNIAIAGTLVKMGVTLPSETFTKELQNHQRGSINKWHPPKHQGDPINHELGSIIQHRLNIESWVHCIIFG